jgi:hypothetical protein
MTERVLRSREGRTIVSVQFEDAQDFDNGDSITLKFDDGVEIEVQDGFCLIKMPDGSDNYSSSESSVPPPQDSTLKFPPMSGWQPLFPNVTPDEHSKGEANALRVRD